MNKQSHLLTVSDKVDRALNVVTCVPVIGGLGAVARFEWGKVQAVSGVAVGIFSAVAASVTKNPETKLQFKKLAVFGSEHAMHGCLNILKSIGEMFLSVATYTLGNPLLLFFRDA